MLPAFPVVLRNIIAYYYLRTMWLLCHCLLHNPACNKSDKNSIYYFEMVFAKHPHWCGLKHLTKLKILYVEVLFSSNSTAHHANSLLCAKILSESSSDRVTRLFSKTFKGWGGNVLSCLYKKDVFNTKKTHRRKSIPRSCTNRKWQV